MKRWAIALVALVGLQPTPVAAAAQLTISVVLPDGSPAAGATIFLNDQRVQADDAGRWRGPAPGEGRVFEAAAAPGYVSPGTRWFDVSNFGGVGSIGVPMTDQLVSVFEPRAFGYPSGTTPASIDQFTSDTGVDRSQELPAETQSVTVSGSVGQRDGRPVVRGDAWLAHPDDSVEFVQVDTAGDQFTVTFPFAAGPGRYQVEINDTTGGAILNVPLFVGVPYVANAPVWPVTDMPGDQSAQQALKALNQLRDQHGLAPVDVDPRLQAIAEDHVADQQAMGWYCHCWSDGTDLFVHARAAGVTVRNRPARSGSAGMMEVGLGEGFATNQGAAGIAQLFTSPGHRSDLLGKWTHVGIASAPGPASVLVIEYADEP